MQQYPIMALYHFFAPCPRGLESVLVTELQKIGASSLQICDGGAKFQGDWHACYRINLESRIASRILWQVADRPYRNEIDIYNIARALPWNEWFSKDLTLRINMAAIKCPLRSLDFITLRVKDAVCDKFREHTGGRPSINTEKPDVRIHGFLNAQKLTLYLDTSGEALFKRGSRKISGDAPLRENLAAGILQLIDWKPGTPLLDPMCGSGTFLLEAARISLNIPSGLGRNFAFEKFKKFDDALWREIKNQAIARQKPVTSQPIYGSDLYGEALVNTRTNFLAAGLPEIVNLKQVNILEISAPTETGIIITNPPYGVRMGEQQELMQLYPRLGDVLKKKFHNWKAYILTADPSLPKLIRLSSSRRTPLFNGALECRLLEYKMVLGGMREIKKSKAM